MALCTNYVSCFARTLQCRSIQLISLSARKRSYIVVLTTNVVFCLEYTLKCGATNLSSLQPGKDLLVSCFPQITFPGGKRLWSGVLVLSSRSLPDWE